MRKLLVLIMALALCLSITACTTKDKEDKTSSTETEVSTDTKDDEAKTTGSMAEFIESVKTQMESMAATFEAQGINMDILERDNALVYSYTYSIDIPDVEAAKTALESNMEATASIFEEVLKSIKMSVPEAKAVVVEYLDKEGNLIFSREFK